MGARSPLRLPPLRRRGTRPELLCLPLRALSRRRLHLQTCARGIQAPHRARPAVSGHHPRVRACDYGCPLSWRDASRIHGQDRLPGGRRLLEALAVSVPAAWRGAQAPEKDRTATMQLEIVQTLPHRLLRGLIHSDGCRVLNRVNGKDHPRYQFCNHSEDVRNIFCRACDDYGVAWRYSNWHTISVSRRRDVARLDQVIGPKT